MALIPFRLALALQDDGWWIRSDIIWHKGSAMPESVTDRPTKCHEHIFLVAKSKGYFYDHIAILEPYAKLLDRWGGDTKKLSDNLQVGSPYEAAHRERKMRPNPDGRNRRDVWAINPKPYNGAHFAVFPPEIPELCILAGSSDRACEHCGAAWERVVVKGSAAHTGATDTQYETGTAANRLALLRQAAREQGGEYVNTTRTMGFRPSCAHYDELYKTQFPRVRSSRKREHQNIADSWFKRVRKRPGKDTWKTVPSIVLDPFAGSGTTCAVAQEHRRHYIGIDANAAYIALAEKRIAAVDPSLNII
jgi:hypothetical protein